MKPERSALHPVVLMSVLAAGCGEAGAPASGGPPLGRAASLDQAPVCLTIQRGLNGNVADALIATDGASDGSTTKNYGASSSLAVGAVGAGQRQTLLRFDVGAVPPDATVTSAVVTLNVLLYGGAPVRAHLATAPWDEPTVTWASFAESFAPAVAATFPAGTPTSADITPAVQAWVSGASPNDGLLLERDLTGSTVFASSEYLQSLRPQLALCYLPGPCAGEPDGTPCPAGVCGGGVCRPLGTTCASILASDPSATDGVYTIQPTGAAAPFAAYCDMTTDGGGWTLMATLHTTSVQASNASATSVWGAWSDDWFAQDHGSPADPTVAFSNQDARKFAGIVGPSTVLRVTTPPSAADPTPKRRYHVGFLASDWSYWNASRTVNGANVIGPFSLPNVVVTTDPGLASPPPVEAQVNGHWFNGAFFLGTAPNDYDNDDEGLRARYQVGSVQQGVFALADDLSVDAFWYLWLR